MNRQQREALTKLISAEVFYIVGMMFILTAIHWINIVFGLFMGGYGYYTAIKSRDAFIGNVEEENILDRDDKEIEKNVT